MSFTAEEAKLIAGYTLATYEHEMAITKRVIAAIPAGQEQYKPDPISMSTLELAFHLVSSEQFFLNGATSGAFASGEPKVPENVKTAADVLAWYDEHIPTALAAAKAMPPADAARIIDFFGMMQAPAITYLTLMLTHSSHHRGQLSAYLRPMGGKVPSIYGPSGDSGKS